jgi:hypothetical protein
MESQSATMPASQPEGRADHRSISPVLKSYFYWSYARGSFQYDVMVTLILLFIFLTPHLWDFGDKPSTVPGPSHPIEVSTNGGHGVIITVQAEDVSARPGASASEVKRALRQAIEPVTGDAVFVERWETVKDAEGNLAWKVWAHK